MRPLPQKFAQLIAIMDGSSFEPERITAREAATRLAEAYGWVFEVALRGTTRHHPRDLPPTRDEATAAAEAGHREAVLRDVERREWEARTESIVALYGNLSAALAPCWRESALFESVARWRVTHPASCNRWTATLDGCSLGKKISAAVIGAVERAYFMPTSFDEARLELDYWAARDVELTVLRQRESIGLRRGALDIVVIARQDAITSLMRHKLRAQTVHDLRQRMLAIGDAENVSPCCWEALRRDIIDLAARDTGTSCPDRDLSLNSRLRRVLEQNRDLSDRAIAREVGCSPTTVGKMRRVVLPEMPGGHNRA